jgi:uncharacterized protein YndB with AHSA1/START domain
MTSQVYTFEAHEGGKVRVSLTYEDPSRAGKTVARTDTYHGRFVKLVPNEQVVEVDEFETANPALQGEMTSTITLSDSDGGTNVEPVHDGLPPGVAPADNELGWRLALAKLAKLSPACSARMTWRIVQDRRGGERMSVIGATHRPRFCRG